MQQSFHAGPEGNPVPFDIPAGGPNPGGLEPEIEAGLHLDDLAPGALLEVTTRHNRYLLENIGDGKVVIQGHEFYCPSPTVVRLLGSVREGTALKERYIGWRMRLEFVHPEYHVVRTSQIQLIRVLPRS